MAAPKVKLSFVVHSCAQEPFPATATVAGKDMTVTVEGLVVELVSPDGAMTLTIRHIPEDMDQALAVFAPEGSVDVVITPSAE